MTRRVRPELSVAQAVELLAAASHLLETPAPPIRVSPMVLAAAVEELRRAIRTEPAPIDVEPPAVGRLFGAALKARR